MFVAIFSTLLQSFSDTFWKKSLNYGVGGKIHDLLSYPLGVIICIYFILQNLHNNIFDVFLVILVGIVMLLAIIRTQITQKIFRSEKMSVLAPYANINKIIILISSFFLFKDVSIISLFIAILAIGVIIISAIDFKKHSLPKNIYSIVLVELMRAVDVLIGGWIIFNYNEIDYFIIVTIWGAIILIIFVFIKKQLSSIQSLPKSFWVQRFIGSLGWISWFLSLTIIKNLGLSISILLGFLSVGATLLFAYMFSKDVPSKKDLIVTIIVMILVGVGFYFK